MFVSGTQFFLAWLLPVSGAAQMGSGALVGGGTPLTAMCHPVASTQAGLKTDIPRDRYIRVQHLAERRELVIDLGPMDVGPGSTVEQGPRLMDQLAVLPMDGWLHGFRIELRDADGYEVPRTLLHHIALVRPTYRDLFLPQPQRFMVMGAETEDRKFPAWMAGVPMRAGDPLVLNVQLHNPTDRSYRGVTVRLVLAYTTRRPDLEVHGFRVDVMFPTGYMVFDLPPGRSVWTWEGSPGFEGRVFALTGHVHRYAEWIVLEDVTERRELYRAEPTRSASGAIVEMPVRLLSWGRGYVMRPSHRYRLTASYFNPTDQPIVAGGVANVGGIYAPEDDLPPLERTGTAYSRNLSVAPVECGSTTSLGAQLAPLPAAP